jgi:hypothetical protein
MDADWLRLELADIKSSGALGRSVILRRLFDFLAACTLEDRSPKEVEIAGEVFGRRSSFDASQDATVRVYVHKLRRKLDELYAGPRRLSAYRLTIPLGEYRLARASSEPERNPSIPAPSPPGARHRSRILLASAALGFAAVSSGATWLVLQNTQPAPARQIAAVRRDPVWAPLLSNGLPTLVVVGDYYIFGESDDGIETSRLVREYTVNSREDLDQFIMQHPQKSGRYVDLNLRYVAVGSAFALRDALAVLDAEGRLKASKMVLSSELTPDMLKTNNIVYLGYLSGLGMLRDIVFSGSRFTVGDTYDELDDSASKLKYVSGGGGPISEGSMYRDYGYFSTFKGPANNVFVIVAGTRDEALMQTAEAVTQERSLREAEKLAGQSQAFEALYQVEGMSRINLGGKLVTASPLKLSKIWKQNGGQSLTFPAG